MTTKRPLRYVLIRNGKYLTSTLEVKADFDIRKAVQFKTEKAALNHRPPFFDVVSTSFINPDAPRAMKKVRNLMTGKEIEIEADTPLCCDPSTETYWSM